MQHSTATGVPGRGLQQQWQQVKGTGQKLRHTSGRSKHLRPCTKRKALSPPPSEEVSIQP